MVNISVVVMWYLITLYPAPEPEHYDQWPVSRCPALYATDATTVTTHNTVMCPPSAPKLRAWPHATQKQFTSEPAVEFCSHHHQDARIHKLHKGSRIFRHVKTQQQFLEYQLINAFFS